MPVTIRIALAAVTLGVLAQVSTGGTLTVTSVEPAPNSVSAPVSAAITVHFDRPLLTGTVTLSSFRAFGRWSGAVEGKFSFSNNDQTVTLTPENPLSAGEPVMVTLSHNLAAADGSPMRPAGYGFRFWTATRPTCLTFENIGVMSNRTTPGEQTRIYGALGSDTNNDGWLDIVTVNEVSADLRTFLNKADGSGEFHPFIQPPDPGLPEMSPNEPADFNNDGFSDVCVASTDTDRILVFLGAGDGSYQPAQIIVVHDRPLGVAVLDLDGDGDMDIVNGNHGGNDMSRLMNTGAGVFGTPSYFEGGVSGEYGVAAADMDRDGIFDIVVGGNSSQEAGVLRGNGNGTLTIFDDQDCGGLVWQLGTGDVNGDGFEDVHTSNSFSSTGSILLNDGTGHLLPPQTEDTDGHSPATDLGDFDGDGDLDWLLSSFGGGLWRLYLNDGNANFTVSQDFEAPDNPSCGTAMDLNNDQRLDIVLLDEIADVVILMRNDVKPGDTNCDNLTNVDDLLNVINTWGPCSNCPTDLAPIGGNGIVNVDDLLAVINGWG